MAAIADLIAYDGEATPLAHTFKPVYVRNENGKQVALYREAVSGVPLEAQPSFSFSQEILKSGVHKFVARVTIPVMESVSGQNAAGYTAPPKVAYTVNGDLTIFAPARSTPLQRRNIRHLALNVLAGSVTAGGPYTTGPAADLFDNGISPT